MRNAAALGAAMWAAIGLSGPAWADDFADDASTGGRIAVGDSVTGEIETEGDIDWFAAEFEEGESYAIDLEGAPTGQGSLPDAFLHVFDDAGGELATDDDGGTGFNSRLIFEAPATATFYIGAAAFSSGTGTYTLSLDEFTPPPDDVANDESTAATVAVGESVTGEIEVAGDSDWYAVDLQAGETYAFTLEGTPSGGGTLPDTYLTLYDEVGTPIQENDDGGESFEARLIVSPGTSGRYYIAASGFGSSTGTYTLRTGVYEAPPDDYAADETTAGTLAVGGGSVQGAIEASQDRDWFAVELTGGQGYAFSLEGAPTGGGSLDDPYLTLLDPAGNEIAWDDDGGEGFNSRLQYTPQADGRFFVAAGAFADHTGTYTLSLSEFVPPPDDYPADMTTGGTITPGQSVTGEIGHEGDEDWFAVELESGVSYTIRQEGSPTGQGSLSDPLLRLYDGDGALVEQNDDDGETLNSRMTFTPAMSGTFYIGAAAFASNTGTYTLSVSGGDDGAVSGDNIQIIVEMTDGERLRLLVPRDYLSEMESIFIGPQ
ncbi:MAG: hypothetical protein GVY13_19760 [Alphaproteobacteria bacterium]|jgi:hypothetical protein|nr:hypothetical protein [Alphaproteobacteria bacterium]